MIISVPAIQSNVCVKAHPRGCGAAVARQIDYVKSLPPLPRPPRTALVVGCSMGYGLASRIVAAFGGGAQTVGVSYERPGSHRKAGSPGWYNNIAFDRAARDQGLASISLSGDAFSDEVKEWTAGAIRSLGQGIDLLVYSVASPVRTDPVDGITYRSAIKPIGRHFAGRTVNIMSGKTRRITVPPATEEEILGTVKVMGGEDWKRWVDFLSKQNLLSEGFRTVAYSYIGPTHTHPIYRQGTLGRAKEHLENTARELQAQLTSVRGDARVAVCKALVTRASSVIPVVPLYIACLYKVMKAKGLHEDCIRQMARLFRDRLGAADGTMPMDEEGRIRIDDWEMRPDVQEETAQLVKIVNTLNISELSDIDGYRQEFMEIHGFGIQGVDYSADVDPATV